MNSQQFNSHFSTQTNIETIEMRVFSLTDIQRVLKCVGRELNPAHMELVPYGVEAYVQGLIRRAGAIKDKQLGAFRKG